MERIPEKVKDDGGITASPAPDSRSRLLKKVDRVLLNYTCAAAN